MKNRLFVSMFAVLVIALFALPRSSWALTLTRGVPTSLTSVDGAVLVHSVVDSITIGSGYTAYGTYTSGLNIPATRIQYDVLNTIKSSVTSFTISYNPALGGKIRAAATPISYINSSGSVVTLGGSPITTVFKVGYGIYSWNPGAPWTIDYQPDHVTFSAPVGGLSALPGGTAVGYTNLGNVSSFILDIDPSVNVDNVTAQATGANLNGPLTGNVLGPMVPVMDIPGAKQKPDGTLVTVTGKIITAIFPNSDYFYIEEPNRRAGIRVRSGVMPDYYPQTITVTGVMQTVNAEHEIFAANVVYGTQIAPLQPLLMTNKTFGGAKFGYQPAVPPGASGLNNIGLLVRTTGRVTAKAAGNFYVDDGCGLSDALKPGLTVIPAPGMLLPPVGSYVTLTGISGAEVLTVPIRVLRLRDKNDMQVARGPIAYIYSTDIESAMQFKNLLEANALTTVIMSVTEAETANLSKYGLIIIGSETGSFNNWGTSAALTSIMNANTQVLGVGDGGYALFGKLSLFIGWPNGWHGADTQLIVANAVSPVYSWPNSITIPTDGTLTLYDTPTASTAINVNNVPANVDMLGKQLQMTPPDWLHDLLIAQKGKYLLWGFNGSPMLMTPTGKDLFINSVWYLLK